MKVLEAVMEAGLGGQIVRYADGRARVVNMETLRNLSDEDATANDWDVVEGRPDLYS